MNHCGGNPLPLLYQGKPRTMCDFPHIDDYLVTELEYTFPQIITPLFLLI